MTMTSPPNVPWDILVAFAKNQTLDLTWAESKGFAQGKPQGWAVVPSTRHHGTVMVYYTTRAPFFNSVHYRLAFHAYNGRGARGGRGRHHEQVPAFCDMVNIGMNTDGDEVLITYRDRQSAHCWTARVRKGDPLDCQPIPDFPLLLRLDKWGDREDNTAPAIMAALARYLSGATEAEPRRWTPAAIGWRIEQDLGISGGAFSRPPDVVEFPEIGTILAPWAPAVERAKAIAQRRWIQWYAQQGVILDPQTPYEEVCARWCREDAERQAAEHEAKKAAERAEYLAWVESVRREAAKNEPPPYTYPADMRTYRSSRGQSMPPAEFCATVQSGRWHVYENRSDHHPYDMIEAVPEGGSGEPYRRLITKNVPETRALIKPHPYV